MTEFYSELFKYRSGERREHLENFLTVALVSTLERLPLEAQRRFVFEFLLHPAIDREHSRHFRDEFSKAKGLRWQSQFPVPYDGVTKRCDVCLTDGAQRPLLMIESKVGTKQFTRHTQQEEQEDEDEEAKFGAEEVTQLQFYGRHLRSRNKNGALILLTNGATAPDGFVNGHKSFGVDLRAVCPWIRVHDWLSSISGIKGTSAAAFLRDALKQFLKAEGIRDMNERDLKVLGSYYKSRAQLENADRRLSEVMKAARFSLGRLKVRVPNIEFTVPKDEEWGVLVSYSDSIRSRTGAACRIGWGFSSGDGPWFERKSSALLVAFVSIHPNVNIAEKYGLKGLNKKLSEWQGMNLDDDSRTWTHTIEVKRFLRDPKGFTDGFISWLQPQVQKAIKLAQELAK